MNEIQIEKALEDFLENNTLEEFFEQFNITPLEVVLSLYFEGMLDEDILNNITPSDLS